MNSELNHESNHSDPDVLALLAMGETVPDAEARHVASCAQCRRDVVELRRVVDLARDGTPGGFAEAPSSDVWTRISTQLGLAGDIVPASIRRAGAAAGVASVADAVAAERTSGSAAGGSAGAAAELASGSAAEPAQSAAESAATPRIEPDAASPSAHTAAPAGQPALHAVPRSS
ncbi:MAG: hypothetical protein LH605_01385, partial [Microbacteriaceae bacterium]|nr:hypothetical protein [Microbacteriaceae bacterium]